MTASVTRQGTDLLEYHEAARELTMSVRTLREHVKDGSISYVITGRGKKRPRKAFMWSDIEDFKSEQKRRSAPEEACRSTGRQDRASTSSTSGGEVVGFSVLQARRANAQRAR